MSEKTQQNVVFEMKNDQGCSLGYFSLMEVIEMLQLQIKTKSRIFAGDTFEVLDSNYEEN